jgi:hypothetical protein
MDIAVHRTGSKTVSTNEAHVSVHCVIVQSIKRTPASRQKRYVARNARFNDMSISSARYFETPAVQFHATAVELQGRRSMLLQPLLK